MWNDVETHIRTVLDAINLLKPYSARIILNRNSGKPEPEDLRLYCVGKSNAAIEAVDSRFFGIMGSQNIIQIPSILQSTLLSNLSLGEGAAVFIPLKSRFGYCGYIWACFPENVYSDKVLDIYTGCCEWAEMILQKWLEEELSVQNQANHYVDLMERMKIPTLVLIQPDRLLISNPSFERMKEKESFLNALRNEAENSEEDSNRFAEFDFILKKIDFSNEQNGRIYVFPNAGSDIREIRFGENEIQYYHLLTRKAIGTLSLLESSGDLTNLQKSYIGKAESPLQRLESLFEYGTKHYQRTENSTMSFEVLSVTEIAKQVIFDLAAAARNKRVEIELNTDGGSKGRSTGNAVGDPWLLTLAIYDMLDNAIRFSSMDGKPINVSIQYDENDWTLSVEDFGTGISPLDLEKMREQSYAEAAGSGLHGIALVKYVAKVHNGKLEIDSRLGKGSRFTLTIPYY